MLTRTNLILFIAMTLATQGISAMQPSEYSMTIENQTFSKQYLNVPDPRCITDKSPYAYVESNNKKTFLVTEKDKDNQSIAFPCGWPINKVNLPINKKNTHFTIKLQNSPGSPTKIVVTDDTGVSISELHILCNPQ